MVITSLLWSSNRRRFTSASVPATTAAAIMGIGTLTTMDIVVGIMVVVDMAMAGIDKRLGKGR